MNGVSWIKITTDIFDNRKIKQIEALPDGDALIVIWVKLLCLAGTTNDDGAIYLTPEVPFTEDMLSVEFGKPINTIRLAIEVFRRFGMIDIVEDIIYISNWSKYQNIEGMEKVREQGKLRMRRMREKRALGLESGVCQYCGAEATGADHIISISKGGEDKDYNKVPCCEDCNNIKNNQSVVDFLNSNRDRVKDKLVTSNAKLSLFVTLNPQTNQYEAVDDYKKLYGGDGSDVTSDVTVTVCDGTDKDIDIDIELKEKENLKEKESPKKVAIPDNCFEDDRLNTAIEEWVKHRSEIHKPYKTQQNLDKTIARIKESAAVNGVEWTVEQIELCIESGYQGLFIKAKPKNNGSYNSGTQQRGYVAQYDYDDLEGYEGLV